MLRMSLTYDTFGGRETVLNFLFEHGLLNRNCPNCHQPKNPMNEAGRTLPRCKCGQCNLRFCCAENTPLKWEKILNVPLFLFIVHCYVLRVSTKAVQTLSGADYRTVRRYIKIILDAVTASCKRSMEWAS